MATMWTPPIDLYDEEQAAEAPMGRDDREIGFSLPPAPGPETHPRDNGDVDVTAVRAGKERWGSVLGW
jgi:hypothetical protein